jgi:hypothetical protein
MPRVKSPAQAWNQLTPLQRGWKREMQRSAPVKEKVFPIQLKKETPKDSALGWEWGKGLFFPSDATEHSRRRSLLPAFRNERGFCPSQEDQMASQPFPGK